MSAEQNPQWRAFTVADAALILGVRPARVMRYLRTKQFAYYYSKKQVVGVDLQSVVTFQDRAITSYLRKEPRS